MGVRDQGMLEFYHWCRDLKPSFSSSILANSNARNWGRLRRKRILRYTLEVA